MTHDNKHPEGEASWFEQASNQRLMIIGLIVACLATVVVQLVFPMFDDHHPPHFPKYENFLGFQAFFGFVAFVVIVYLGKALRLIVKREESYYDL